MKRAKALERVERSEEQQVSDVHATAAQGVQGPARQLPHLDAVQASFGRHDVSGVRAHVGGVAEAACRSLGAEAYAVGDQIAFRRSPDLATTAHEAAHVVQQRRGVDVEGGVGRAGDRYERHADAIASLVVRGQPAAEALDRASAGSPGGAQRVQAKSGAEHVGGDSSKVEFLSAGDLGTLAPGEANYSRQMLMHTPQAADKLAERYSKNQLRNLLPDFQVLELQKKRRGKEVTFFKNLSDGFFTSPFATKQYKKYGNWSKGHLKQISQDRALEEEKFNAYNGWVPQANGVVTSMSRLHAMEGMLGIHDLEAMTRSLVRGMADVQTVAERAFHAQGKGRGGLVPLPRVDTTLHQMAAETVVAGKKMTTAFLGFQQEIYRKRAAKVDAEGDAARKRLKEITQIKTFLKSAGGTVDKVMSVVSGAPAAISNASSRVAHARASLAASANQQRILRDQRPLRNPTYVALDANGNMVVRNVQTSTDTVVTQDANGKTIVSKVDTPESDGGISLPSSVSSILGGIADFIYAKEVRQLNAQLEAIKARVAGEHAAREFAGVRQRTQAFQNALNHYALKCRALQDRMAQRRVDYQNFGVVLDNFARESRECRKNGLAPGKGKERYATILTLVSQIRETYTLAVNTKGGFDSPAAVAKWALKIRSNRMDAPIHKSIQHFGLPDGEFKPLDKMYREVKDFHWFADWIIKNFKAVETAAAKSLAGLHAGGGGGRY